MKCPYCHVHELSPGKDGRMSCRACHPTNIGQPRDDYAQRLAAHNAHLFAQAERWRRQFDARGRFIG